MSLLRLGLTVGDRVTVRQDVTCAFCATNRTGASGRSGRIVDVHDIAEVGMPTDCPPDHTYAVLYDQPWTDDRAGAVRRQYFAFDELQLA